VTVREAAGAIMRALAAGDVPLVATSYEPALGLALQPGKSRASEPVAVFHVKGEDGDVFRVWVSER
jgi:hypothetical protein